MTQADWVKEDGTLPTEVKNRFDEFLINASKLEITEAQIIDYTNQFWAKELLLAQQRTEKKWRDGLELWFSTHDRLNKSFDTDSLIKFIEEEV